MIAIFSYSFSITPASFFFNTVILTGCLFCSHAHPGSPYVFGLAGVDHDVEFPDPMPVIGILILPIAF